MVVILIVFAIFIGLAVFDYIMDQKHSESVYHKDVGWINMHPHSKWWSK